MRKLLALLLLLAPSLALAGTVKVDWDNPTTNEDGTALASSSITRTRIEYGTCGAGGVFGVKAGEFIAAGAAVTATSPNLAAGTWCFRAFTTATGLESASSGVLQVVVPQSPPKPPTLRTLAVVAGINMTPLYRINANGTRGDVVVGFVPVGDACTGPVVFTYRGRSYQRPEVFSRVQWWGTTPTTNAAAACG